MAIRNRRWIGWVGVLAGVAGPLVAQDVSVEPLTWLTPEEAADELPVASAPLRPKFPGELKKTSLVGWAEIDTFVDEKGTVGMQEITGSLPFYEEAITSALNRGTVTYRPGRRGGLPTATRVRQVVLFNPRSAAEDDANATPRLLSAMTTVDPSRQVTYEACRIPPDVVWVVVHLDDRGQVTQIRGGPERLKTVIGESLRHWRFAPARRERVPVEADLRVPVILTSPDGLRRPNLVPARPVVRKPPVYPDAERRAGVQGGVMLEFTVSPEGEAEDITAVQMTTRGFAMAASTAVQKWKFAPARLDGKPVPMRMQQTITFSLSDEFADDEGGDGVVIRQRGDMSKLPEQFRFETPPLVQRLHQPKYPYALLREGVRGSAEVAIVINPQGRVTDSKVVHADRPEFGYALQAAVEQFRYRPALKNGDPTTAMIRVQETFDLTPAETLIVSDRERGALKLEREHPEAIARATELDEPLKPVDVQPPVYPCSVAGGVAGRALVEFLVDGGGGVLLPRIVSASEPPFGFAAMQAVADWRFAPPKKRGQSVMTRVRVPVEFAAPGREEAGR